MMMVNVFAVSLSNMQDRQVVGRHGWVTEWSLKSSYNQCV